MKLYNFTANDYGENWFVVAKSKDEAVEYVRKGIQDAYEAEISGFKKEIELNGWDAEADYWKDRFESAANHRDSDLHFVDCCVMEMAVYIGGPVPSINEIEPGKVVFTEVS